MTIAIVTAVLVAAVLGLAVFAIWSGDPVARNGNQLVVNQTPTPRAVRRHVAGGPGTPGAATVAAVARVAAVSPATPAASHEPRAASVAIGAVSSPTAAPAADDAPAATEVPAIAPAESPPAEPAPTTVATAPPTATPSPVPPTATAVPRTPTVTPAFAASDAAELAPFATGRWATVDDMLVITDPPLVAEPWLTIPTPVPAGDFAVEAEIKIAGLAPGVCNQNFGLIVSRAGLARGGGIIFPCGETAPRARLTDVGNWADGYDRDYTLADAAADRDDDWHTYRLEVRGNELSLRIDGKEVVIATDPAMPATGESSIGLWSQGTQLEIRRLALYEP